MIKPSEQLLAGKKVIVTRAPQQAKELAQRIQLLGGQAIVCSMIETVATPITPVLLATFQAINRYDAIIFTSVNAVQFFFKICAELELDLSSWIKIKCYAVGPKTAEVINKFGILAEPLPPVFNGEQLALQFNVIHHECQHVLLPRALIASEKLPELLRNAGHLVDEIAIYETVRALDTGSEAIELLSVQQIDMITFTSPSTVYHFWDYLIEQGVDKPLELLCDVDVFCIGPFTAESARKLGLQVTATASESTIDSLIETISLYQMNKRED